VISLGAPTTSLRAPGSAGDKHGSAGDKPGSAGDMSGSSSNHSHVFSLYSHLCICVSMYLYSYPSTHAISGLAAGVVLATVPDRHFGSGSVSEPNRCQIGGPGCQHTRSVDSGTVRCKSPNPSGLGGLSAGRTAGPSVDLYNVLVFAVA